MKKAIYIFVFLGIIVVVLLSVIKANDYKHRTLVEKDENKVNSTISDFDLYNCN